MVTAGSVAAGIEHMFENVVVESPWGYGDDVPADDLDDLGDTATATATATATDSPAGTGPGTTGTRGARPGSALILITAVLL
jgi:hypothetical protein